MTHPTSESNLFSVCGQKSTKSLFLANKDRRNKTKKNGGIRHFCEFHYGKLTGQDLVNYLIDFNANE